MLEPIRQSKLSLALGGGAIRGVAHLGFLRALEEAQLEVSAIAGTSSGALVGLLYALERGGHMSNLEWQSVLDLLGAKRYHALANIQDASWTNRLMRLPVALRGLRNPFLTTLNPVEKVLDEIAATLDFCDLPIPLAFVATDIERGRPIILQEGPVVPAVLASCAIPGVFPPVFHDGRYLADGYLVNNLPADVARTLLKGKPGVVVAVNVDANMRSTKSHNSLEAYSRGVSISRNHLSILASEEADLVLNVGLEVPASFFDIDSAEALYEAGLAAGHNAVAAIRSLMETRSGSNHARLAEQMSSVYLTHS